MIESKFSTKLNEETLRINFKSTDECQLFIGANKQFPSKDVGTIFLD